LREDRSDNNGNADDDEDTDDAAANVDDDDNNDSIHTAGDLGSTDTTVHAWHLGHVPHRDGAGDCFLGVLIDVESPSLLGVVPSNSRITQRLVASQHRARFFLSA
jgi:hypothetical protein